MRRTEALVPLAQPAQGTEVDPPADTTSLSSELNSVAGAAPLFVCRYDGPFAGSNVSGSAQVAQRAQKHLGQLGYTRAILSAQHLVLSAQYTGTS